MRTNNTSLKISLALTLLVPICAPLIASQKLEYKKNEIQTVFFKNLAGKERLDLLLQAAMDVHGAKQNLKGWSKDLCQGPHEEILGPYDILSEEVTNDWLSVVDQGEKGLLRDINPQNFDANFLTIAQKELTFIKKINSELKKIRGFKGLAKKTLGAFIYKNKDNIRRVRNIGRSNESQ